MSGAREEILSRVRRALTDVPQGERPEDVPVARGYRRRSPEPAAELIRRFADRVRDYRSDVRTVTATDLSAEISGLCAQLGLRRVVVPGALPEAWRPADVEVVEDERLSVEELDSANGAVTGCATAIAETGTILLDGHGTSGRRAITLLPDHHICIIRAEQIVGSVPEALDLLAPTVLERQVPVTLISGPSASSDIELTRVEGVHGPRHLHVLVVTEER